MEREPLKEILVIGGSGFVGKALIPMLLGAGHLVTVLNRGNHKMTGVLQIVADRDDQKAMSKLTSEFDVVIDTSGYTKRQVETALSVFGKAANRWIHLSSAAVYSEKSDGLATEDDPLGGDPIWGEYGVDKSEADEFLIEAVDAKLAILRPPYLYGPNNTNDRETFIWSRVLSGRPIIYPGNGSALFQFLHVEDLAAIITHLVDAEFENCAVYNIAEPETMNAETWAKRLAKLLGGNLKLVSGDIHAAGITARKYFPFRDYPCALDVRKFMYEMNWKFRFDFDNGMKNTLSCYDLDELDQCSPSSPEELRILSDM